MSGRRANVRVPMNVTCPGCATTYLLPETLLGRDGARVRCPACGHRFVVTPTGGIVPDHAPAPPGGAAPGAIERGIAREVVAALEARLGGGLAAAVQAGDVFQRHGPALIAAFDDYRQRAGSHAGSEAFRAELRERCGLDLFPAIESPAH